MDEKVDESSIKVQTQEHWDYKVSNVAIWEVQSSRSLWFCLSIYLYCDIHFLTV